VAISQRIETNSDGILASSALAQALCFDISWLFRYGLAMQLHAVRFRSLLESSYHDVVEYRRTRVCTDGVDLADPSMGINTNNDFSRMGKD